MTTSTILQLGIAQIASNFRDIDENFKKHHEWIRRGHEAKLDILVFPEVSLAGHHGTQDLLGTALKRDDPRLLKLAEAAGDMRVVIGFIEEGPAAQFYNSAAIIHGGKFEHLHRKINIPNYGKLEEGKHFAKGRFIETTALDEYWRAGLMICADLWNPALVHLAFLHGATFLISPISSAIEAVGAGFDNPGGWGLTNRFYAMMYGAPIIMANRCGAEMDLTFWGGSRIVNAFGEEIAIAGSDEELLVATLDYENVRRARSLLPTVRDSDLSLVMRETERLAEELGIPDFVR